jgi:tetratricopeptide (TPR) repeat protein
VSTTKLFFPSPEPLSVLKGARLTARSILAVVCLGATLAGLPSSRQTRSRPSPETIATLRREAFDRAYNLDEREATDLLHQALATYPDEPSLYRSLAAVTWLRILFERGAVTTEHFSGGLTARVAVERPPPELDRQFRAAVDRAIALAEARVARAPADPDAYYELGAAVGLRTTYVATVEGAVLEAIRSARRAFDAHERVLALDPRRKDAGLIVGAYRYAVGSMPAPLRLMAYLIGFGGGRERGLRMIEEAAAYPSDAQPEAEFVLVLLYNREARYADALRVLAQLERRYPRNRLLWLEEGLTAARAGDLVHALRALDEGVARLGSERRPLAAGERALWYWARGAARLRLGQRQAAEADLRRAAQETQGAPWIHGRVQLELGRLADLAGDRASALAHYRQAARLCEAGRDATCRDQATRFMREPYRSE